MEQKIKSISEAFSIQPKHISVCQKTEDGGYPVIGVEPTPHVHKEDCLKEIKQETINIGKEYGHPVEKAAYVCYDFNGNKVYHHLAESVNVHYFNS